jgi:hypothetical protein
MMVQSDEQGVELRAEYSVRSAPPPYDIITLSYIWIKKCVREIARRHEGVAKHVIG